MKSNLNFKWDKNEERFIKKQAANKLSTNSIKDVGIYLDFLAGINSSKYHHIKNKNSDAKFHF